MVPTEPSVVVNGARSLKVVVPGTFDNGVSFVGPHCPRNSGVEGPPGPKGRSTVLGQRPSSCNYEEVTNQGKGTRLVRQGRLSVPPPVLRVYTVGTSMTGDPRTRLRPTRRSQSTKGIEGGTRGPRPPCSPCDGVSSSRRASDEPVYVLVVQVASTVCSQVTKRPSSDVERPGGDPLTVGRPTRVWRCDLNPETKVPVLRTPNRAVELREVNRRVPTQRSLLVEGDNYTQTSETCLISVVYPLTNPTHRGPFSRR